VILDALAINSGGCDFNESNAKMLQIAGKYLTNAQINSFST
jgi:hypothetical protein